MKRAGCERRRRILSALTALDVGNVEVRTRSNIVDDFSRRCFVGNYRLLRVNVMELRSEFLSLLLELCFVGPLLYGLESFYLALTLDEQTKCNCLNATG